jgi:hypothetical protein
MAQAILNTPAKVKLVTGSCYEEHTARNLKEPSGVCQLLLGKIITLHKQSGSDDLGRWDGSKYGLTASGLSTSSQHTESAPSHLPPVT